MHGMMPCMNATSHRMASSHSVWRCIYAWHIPQHKKERSHPGDAEDGEGSDMDEEEIMSYMAEKDVVALEVLCRPRTVLLCKS